MVTTPLHVALRSTTDPRIVITGTVVSRNTSTVRAIVDVDGYGTRVEVPYVGGAPTVGATAVLIRSANRLWLIGTHGTTTITPPPEPDPNEPATPTNPKPPPPPSTSTVTLRPTATGTARGGSVRPDTGDLYQGDWTGRGINSGQAVYRARQLSGTVTRARLRIKRLDAGVYAAQAATLRLMTQNSLTGSPTWQDSTGGPQLRAGETRTVTLPRAWGQKLINGQAGGIGIHVSGSSPYVRLAGRAAGFMSLTLTIEG